MLAGILADAIASQPEPAGRAAAAGRAWADISTRAWRREISAQAIERLTDLLTDLGFAPEKRSAQPMSSEIGLRNCPFLELARTHRDVVCPCIWA